MSDFVLRDDLQSRIILENTSRFKKNFAKNMTNN